MSRPLFASIVFAAVAGTLSAQVSVSVSDFGTVRAGETARIEWRGLPSEAEELEILLSVDERELPVRVTPQLAARAGALIWRVPNLPSRRARLTVRFGLEGREIESAPSAVFEILPSEVEPAVALVYREGEWWVQERSESPLRGFLGNSPEGDRIQEERESPPCSVASAPLTLSRRERPRPEPTLPNGIAITAPRAFPPRSPLEVPPRI